MGRRQSAVGFLVIDFRRVKLNLLDSYKLLARQFHPDKTGGDPEKILIYKKIIFARDAYGKP